MAGLEGLYQQIIIDHSKQRHGDGPLEGADAEYHEYNPTCGDDITMRVRIAPSHERIDAVAWQGARGAWRPPGARLGGARRARGGGRR